MITVQECMTALDDVRFMATFFIIIIVTFAIGYMANMLKGKDLS